MSKLLVISGLFCALIMLMLVSCDDDCPTCPSPPTDPVSDYDVYLHGLVPSPIYVYNTSQMAVIDSFQFCDHVGLRDIEVSANGRDIMVAVWNDTTYGTKVFNMESGELVTSFDFGMSIEVSNDGRYVMLNDYGNIYFLDGDTYEIIFSDAITCAFNGRFLNDGSKFFCVKDDYYIHIYDMATQTIDTVFMYFDSDGLTPAVYHIQPDASGDKIYFTCAYSPYRFYLKAYSLTDDSTTFEYSLADMADADLRLTPDGLQIIFTDPGWVMIEKFGSMNVFFIDPATDAIISMVNAGRSVQGFPPSGFFPGLTAITPDSRYTLITCAGGGPGYGMIDNQQHRFVDVSLFEIQSIAFATCQKTLK